MPLTYGVAFLVRSMYLIVVYTFSKVQGENLLNKMPFFTLLRGLYFCINKYNEVSKQIELFLFVITKIFKIIILIFAQLNLKILLIYLKSL
jgi:hypothetical protein